MKLSQLIHNLPHLECTGNTADRELLAITADSRQPNSQGIFIAVKGLHNDGAQYAAQAAVNGAAVIIYETEITNMLPELCYLKVASTRQAQADAAALLYNQPVRQLRMTGITGTNGKTSFCYILRHLLNQSGRLTGLFGNIEYDLGKEKIVPRLNTPEAIELQSCLARMVKNGCTDAVMEVSSHGLALDRVRGMEYSAAVFSNLTQDHLDFHGSMEEYASSKALLFNTYLKKEGFAVINADDEWSDYFRSQSRAAVLLFGKKPGCDLQIVDYSYNKKGITVEYCYQNRIFSVSSNLEGSFQIYNLSAAILTALGYGLTVEEITAALSVNLSIPGRLEQIEGGNCKIFVDYAHTPDALEKAALALKDFRPTALIILFGCGGDRDRTKRPLMGQTACRLADRVYITSDNPRSEDPAEIIAEITAGLEEFTNYSVIADRAAAIREAIKDAPVGSALLIAGKGHENYQEIKGVKHHFSDQETVRDYLQRMH